MKRPTNSYRQPLIDLTAEVPGVEPPHSAPVPRPPRPAAWSDDWFNAGQRYADYLAAKSAEDWWKGA